MRSILRMMAALTPALALAACVAGGLGGDKAEGPSPITGSEIEVTALDAPPAEKAGAAKPATPAVSEAPAAEKPAIGPKPRPETLEAASAKEEITPPEAAAPVPEALKTEAHLACERKGDLWVKAGQSGASACVKRTKDAGKHCANGKQCQGECLARSGTCAPYQPLFGCNEVLQDNGVRTTLCLD